MRVSGGFMRMCACWARGRLRDANQVGECICSESSYRLRVIVCLRALGFQLT